MTGRTDAGGVAGDAVVLPAGDVRDELKDVVHGRVRVLAAEGLESPVGLHGGERRVVRIEGGV